jgi:hypothetical protein
VSENCLQTKTRSGKSLCLTKGTLTGATTTNEETEKPVACNGPSGTLANGIASANAGPKIVEGKCVPGVQNTNPSPAEASSEGSWGPCPGQPSHRCFTVVNPPITYNCDPKDQVEIKNAEGKVIGCGRK